LPVGLVVFTIVAALFGELDDIARFSPWSLLMLASAGVVHFVFGRYCAYRSIKAMGANLSAPVTQWSLMVSLVLAIAFLGEKLDLLKLIGIGLLVLGPMLIVARQRIQMRAAAAKPKPVAAAGFQPKLVEGYTFGILSCFGWGSSPILVRAGLDGNGLALAGGVVSYAAATLAVGLVLLLAGPRRDVAGISRRDLRWFSGTGVVTCISQILLYMATAVAPVIIVQPIMRFQNVISTIGGWFLNRQHEVFDPAVLGAIGISIVGAICLAVDASAAMHWLGAPAWMASPFSWTWP
jgi:drug/metabolite transporter (DMT)-like permease